MHNSFFIFVLVSCDEGSIRLVGGAKIWRDDWICLDQAWGTVTDFFFNLPDARVACRQLGYNDTSECCTNLHLYISVYQIKIYFSFTFTCEHSNHNHSKSSQICNGLYMYMYNSVCFHKMEKSANSIFMYIKLVNVQANTMNASLHVNNQL